MSLNFRDLTFLRDGKPKQREAFAALRKLAIFRRLKDFDPVLASTIMIGLDVADSDLDIVCEVHDAALFERVVRREFGHLDKFEFSGHGVSTGLVAKFCYAGFQFELFGQAVPVLQQNACRHLRICYRLLRLAGPETKVGILKLRRRGFKMEPAFAKRFNLKGDPYVALLELEAFDDKDLQRWLLHQADNCHLVSQHT